MEPLLRQAELVSDISGSGSGEGISRGHVVWGVKASRAERGRLIAVPGEAASPSAQINAAAGNANLSYTFCC